MNPSQAPSIRSLVRVLTGCLLLALALLFPSLLAAQVSQPRLVALSGQSTELGPLAAFSPPLAAGNGLFFEATVGDFPFEQTLFHSVETEDGNFRTTAIVKSGERFLVPASGELGEQKIDWSLQGHSNLRADPLTGDAVILAQIGEGFGQDTLIRVGPQGATKIVAAGHALDPDGFQVITKLFTDPVVVNNGRVVVMGQVNQRNVVLLYWSQGELRSVVRGGVPLPERSDPVWTSPSIALNRDGVLYAHVISFRGRTQVHAVIRCAEELEEPVILLESGDDAPEADGTFLDFVSVTTNDAADAIITANVETSTGTRKAIYLLREGVLTLVDIAGAPRPDLGDRVFVADLGDVKSAGTTIGYQVHLGGPGIGIQNARSVYAWDIGGDGPPELLIRQSTPTGSSDLGNVQMIWNFTFDARGLFAFHVTTDEPKPGTFGQKFALLSLARGPRSDGQGRGGETPPLNIEAGTGTEVPGAGGSRVSDVHTASEKNRFDLVETTSGTSEAGVVGWFGRSWHYHFVFDDFQEAIGASRAGDTGQGDSTAVTHGDVVSSGSTNDPVNTYTGELFLEEDPDLVLGGTMSLTFRRTYASGLERAGRTGRMGRNWRHGFEWELARDGASVEIITDRGRLVDFEAGEDGWELTGQKDIAFRLAESAGTFVLLDPRTQLAYVFDAAGKLSAIRDGKGGELALSYDGDVLIGVTDGLGRALTFTHGQDGLLEKVSDGAREVLFAYDAGNLVSATDSAGETTTYTYDAAHQVPGLLSAKTYPRGNTRYTQVYGADARVASQTDAEGNTFSITYEEPDTTVDDPAGNSIVHTHSAGGELTSVIDEDGLSYRFGYTPEGRRASVVDRLGDTTSLSYDPASGELASLAQADGTVLSIEYSERNLEGVTAYDIRSIAYPDGAARTFERDSRGNVTLFTDRAGNDWSFTYNEHGQMLTATSPADGEESFAYNDDGTLASRTDPTGDTTTYGYDDRKRLSRITRPDGAVRELVYDARDQLVSFTDERSATTSIRYDVTGNITAVVDPLGNETTFEPDSMDHLARRSGPLGNDWTATYDMRGALETLTDPAGSVSTLGRDAQGRLTSITDAEGFTTEQTLDAEGVTESITDALGHTTRFTSDKIGRIVGISSELTTLSLRRDAVGRVTELVDGLGETWSATYDARGLTTSRTLPSGIGASYERDALGSVTAVVDPNGNLWPREYDVEGKITSAADPLGNVTSFEYNRRDLASRVGFPEGSVDLSYDEAGNLVRAAYSDGTEHTFSCDANGRMTAASGVTLGYDARGLIVESNGIQIERDARGSIRGMTLAPGKTVSYEYDKRGLATKITDWLGEVTTMSYDAAGQLVEITRPNGIVTSLGYDAHGQIVSLAEGEISSITLTRNERSEIVKASRDVPGAASAETLGETDLEYNAASQVESFSRDALGRRTADSKRTYAWNLASHLTGYTEDGETVSFTYDAFGYRLSRTQGDVTTSYVWNQALGLPSVSIEREGENDTRYHVHTPAGDLLYSVDPEGRHRYYHHDETGNTLFLTDDAGAVIASYAYAPYGSHLASSGVADNPFTWQGRFGVQREGSSGLYYLRARYYDSDSSRFLSPDPVRSLDPRAINPYQYAHGNALAFVDPTGRQSTTAVDWANKRGRFGIGSNTTLGSVSGLDIRTYVSPVFGIHGTLGFVFDPLTTAREGRNNEELSSIRFESGLYTSYKIAYWNRGHLSIIFGQDIVTVFGATPRDAGEDTDPSGTDILIGLGFYGEAFLRQFFSLHLETGLRLDFIGGDEVTGGDFDDIGSDSGVSGFEMSLDALLFGQAGFTVWFK